MALQRIPGDFGAQASLYRSMLNVKRILVLLDNARDIEQVRPLQAIKTLSATGARLSTLADAHRCAANIAWISYLKRPNVVAPVIWQTIIRGRLPGHHQRIRICLCANYPGETKREERRPPNCLRRS